MSATPHVVRLFATVAMTAALTAACSGTGTSSSAPSSAPTVAASDGASAPAAASPSASAEAPASPAASPSASAETGSPAARVVPMFSTDGSYMNAPIDPTPGTILTLRNLGSQAHELRLLRRNDDATDKQTFDDLSKVSAEKLLTYSTVVGVLSADPNTVATGEIAISQTGDYAIVDFLKVGSTTAPASPDPALIPGADTNYSQGMFTTFVAIEPAS